MLNSCNIEGRLVKDIEYVAENNNKPSRARFTLASQRDYVNQATGDRQADFINVVAFRGVADYLNKYASTKGSKIVVSGRLSTETYKDEKGETRSSWSIIADHAYIMSSNNANAQTDTTQAGQQQAQAQQAAQAQPQQTQQVAQQQSQMSFDTVSSMAELPFH